MVTKEIFLNSFLADTPEKAEMVFEEFKTTLNYLAQSYSKSTGLDKADLFSEALVGLARASRDFDKTKSNNFRGYAIFRVKDTIHNYIRKFSSIIVVPSYIKKAQHVLNKIAIYLTSNGVNPNELSTVLQQIFSDEDNIYTNELITIFNRYADRAGISPEELYERIKIIPHTCKFEETSTTYNLDLKIDLARIKSSLSLEEQKIWDLLIEEKSLREISNILDKPLHFVYHKVTAIKNNIKNILI